MPGASSLDEAWAWGLICDLAARARAGRAWLQPLSVSWSVELGLLETHESTAQLVLDPHSESCFQARAKLSASVRQLLELYLPLCIGPGAGELVIAHVGQSLDGQIATASGASRYVTGPENIVHLHRLRALVDAVIVGANTILVDDPELTTRLVPGASPERVVIDPDLRLPHARKVFTDGRAPTSILCRADLPNAVGPAQIPLLRVAQHERRLDLGQAIDALRARGLRRLFVEGGGLTVSKFLEARALSRLHVTICPILVGQGRQGICLPGVERMDQVLRPSVRRFALGEDVLFDCRFGEP